MASHRRRRSRSRHRSRARAEAAAAPPVLSAEMEVRVRRALLACWGVIAGDVEQAWADTGARLTRDGGAEALCDADHLENYGGDAEAVAAFRALPYESQLAMAREAV